MYKKFLRRLLIFLALVCSVWIIFPALNILLSVLGLIEINSPPGPAPVNDYHAQRETIVAGCEDLQHQLPDYPGHHPEYNPGFLDEDTLPTQARISRIADYVIPPVSQALKYSFRESLRLVARRSRQVGNDLAADNLEHFLDNSGETVTDFSVEGLLRDLPVLNDLVRQTLNSSVHSLVTQQLADSLSEPCHQFSTVTSPWIMAGQGISPSIMPNIQLITDPFSPTFQLLYMDAKYPHRDELDVWMAMDPIWYALGESVIANIETGQTEICYQVFIYFPYHWSDAAFVDSVIGLSDALGISEHYDIKGTSGIRCEGFHLSADSVQMQEDGSQYNFVGLLSR